MQKLLFSIALICCQGITMAAPHERFDDDAAIRRRLSNPPAKSDDDRIREHLYGKKPSHPKSDDDRMREHLYGKKPSHPKSDDDRMREHLYGKKPSHPKSDDDRIREHLHGKDSVHRKMAGLSLEERRFRDDQDYRAADIFFREEDLKENKIRDDLYARDIALREHELELARKKQLPHLDDRRPSSIPHKTRREPSFDQDQRDFDDAIAFASAWSHEDPSRLDSFMVKAVKAYKGYVTRGIFPDEIIDELLERRETILEALSIGKEKIRNKTYASQQEKELIQESIEAGVVGLTYTGAQSIIRNASKGKK